MGSTNRFLHIQTQEARLGIALTVQGLHQASVLQAEMESVPPQASVLQAKTDSAPLLRGVIL